MKKAIPAAALGLGLASYCFLILVSKEATMSSLAILGMMSLAIISVSLWVLWSAKMENIQARVPESQPQDSTPKTESEAYLEITE